MATLRRRGGGAAGEMAAEPAKESGLSRTMKRLDVYPKLQPDFRVQTSSGGTMSLISTVIIVILILSELAGYLTTTRSDKIMVDSAMGQKLRITFNISFPSLNCVDTVLDAMDVSGEQHVDIHHDIFKERLNLAGVAIGGFKENITAEKAAVKDALPKDYCGSCYGAAPAGECCNSCHEVREAYLSQGWAVDKLYTSAEQCVREKENPRSAVRHDEGCRISGFMLVNKVAGNFHVALGHSSNRNSRHLHSFTPSQAANYNVSHVIHHLSFGDDFPGAEFPLDGTRKTIAQGTGVYQYFIKVVPTVYKDGSSALASNQFSVTDQFREENPLPGGGAHGLPGVFFVYDISPFAVHVSRTSVPFTHFLTRICAIGGGVYTVAGLVDSFLHARRKKGSLGKLT